MHGACPVPVFMPRPHLRFRLSTLIAPSPNPLLFFVSDIHLPEVAGNRTFLSRFWLSRAGIHNFDRERNKDKGTNKEKRREEKGHPRFPIAPGRFLRPDCTRWKRIARRHRPTPKLMELCVWVRSAERTVFLQALQRRSARTYAVE